MKVEIVLLVVLLGGLPILAQQIPPQRLPGVTDMARKSNPQDFLKDHFEFVLSLLDHKIETVPSSKSEPGNSNLRPSQPKVDLKPTGYEKPTYLVVERLKSVIFTPINLTIQSKLYPLNSFSNMGNCTSASKGTAETSQVSGTKVTPIEVIVENVDEIKLETSKTNEKTKQSPVIEKPKSSGKQADSSPSLTEPSSPTKDVSASKIESNKVQENVDTLESSQDNSVPPYKPKEESPSSPTTKPADKPQVRKAFDNPPAKSVTPSKALARNEDEDEEIVSTEERPSPKKSGAVAFGDESHPFSLN